MCINILQHTKDIRKSWEASQRNSPNHKHHKQTRRDKQAAIRLNQPIGFDPALGATVGQTNFFLDTEDEDDETKEHSPRDNSMDTTSHDSADSSSSESEPPTPEKEMIVWYDQRGNRKLIEKGSAGWFLKLS